jgi:hypothetical protein
MLLAMGKPRQKHPRESNAFVDGLVEWMDSPDGQRAIDIDDTLWELMDIEEKVELDARQRKFLWPNGVALTFDQSVERIQKLYPDFPRESIVNHLTAWIEDYAPESYTQEQLDELDALTEEWLGPYGPK